MERWLKVVLGTVFGSIGSIIFFLLFDKVFQWFRKARSKAEKGSSVAIPLKVRSRGGGKKNEEGGDVGEMTRLVYEEYDTDVQEVLGLSLESPERVVGLAIFLNDREVEYYWESIPECCRRHDSKEDDRSFRNLMAAVATWAPKWTYAEAVNFLVPSGDLVRSLSKPDTSHCRAVEKFEERHSFRFFIQWSDNYVCDEVASEELWEEAVALGRMLLNSCEQELESAWEQFPVNHWRRRRVRVKGSYFHPGEVSDGTVSDETETNSKVAVTDDLVNVAL